MACTAQVFLSILKGFERNEDAEDKLFILGILCM